MIKLHMQAEIRRVVTGYLENDYCDPSILCGLEDVRKIDGRRQWTKQALLTARIHDPDYVVFSHIDDPDSHILDIGAHFGYSAASIWASKCRAKILSFEANPLYVNVLATLAHICGDRFNFRMVALSDVASYSDFVVPVVNHTLLGAFSTMDIGQSSESLIKHSIAYYETYLAHETFEHYRLYRFSVQTKTLDDSLEEADLAAMVNKLAAIKVDVEGLEDKVLRGARMTLQRYKPLVLAEQGRSRGDLNMFMAAQGYLLASREETYLVSSNEPANSLNQFYIHKSRLVEYVERGFVRE